LEASGENLQVRGKPLPGRPRDGKSRADVGGRRGEGRGCLTHASMLLLEGPSDIRGRVVKKNGWRTTTGTRRERGDANGEGRGHVEKTDLKRAYHCSGSRARGCPLEIARRVGAVRESGSRQQKAKPGFVGEQWEHCAASRSRKERQSVLLMSRATNMWEHARLRKTIRLCLAADFEPTHGVKRQGFGGEPRGGGAWRAVERGTGDGNSRTAEPSTRRQCTPSPGREGTKDTPSRNSLPRRQRNASSEDLRGTERSAEKSPSCQTEPSHRPAGKLGPSRDLERRERITEGRDAARRKVGTPQPLPRVRARARAWARRERPPSHDLTRRTRRSRNTPAGRPVQESKERKAGRELAMKLNNNNGGKEDISRKKTARRSRLSKAPENKTAGPAGVPCFASPKESVLGVKKSFFGSTTPARAGPAPGSVCSKPPLAEFVRRPLKKNSHPPARGRLAKDHAQRDDWLGGGAPLNGWGYAIERGRNLRRGRRRERLPK